MTATRLGDFVDSARQRAFVGRRGELRGFDDALTGRSNQRVLFVHGPAGIGKTTLLHQMSARARSAGRTPVLLDGREIDPSPDGFTHAHGAATAGEADVLLVDGYEQLGPIDAWLRRDLIPSLPADHVVVLAGRDPPAASWRTDPGWREVVGIYPLAHLDEEESADLLARAGVAGRARPRLLDLGRGHPLALVLLADAARAGTVPDRLADLPDLITALVESLLRDAPSDAHMVGLATCAKAWLTTEDVLRETVGAAAPEVWAWLRQRPFVISRPGGLTPHDLTRDVLDAEFERRSPDRYRALHRVIHDHAVECVRQATGPDRHMVAQHLLYLHRRSPLTATFYRLRERGSAALVPARPAEHAELVAMVARWEGPVSAEFAARWLAAEPDGADVVRTGERIAAFTYRIFCPTGSALEDEDPIVRAVLDHVARTGPLRAGERLDITRFVTGAQFGERDEYAVFAGAISSIITWCTRRFAWSFLITADPEFWAPFFDYLAFQPVGRVAVDGRAYLVFGNDWRRFPVSAWLDLMNEREQSGGTGPPPESMLLPPPLDRAAFGAAVKSALQDLNRPDRLAGNPLTGTGLAADADALCTVVRSAVDRLAEQPKGDRLRAVLNRTYVRAAPSQEAAAEVLGLPFSTYRRHLAKAVDAVTEVLWSVEVGGIRLSRPSSD